MTLTPLTEPDVGGLAEERAGITGSEVGEARRLQTQLLVGLEVDLRLATHEPLTGLGVQGVDENAGNAGREQGRIAVRARDVDVADRSADGRTDPLGHF